MRHFYVQVEMLSSVACRGQQRERDVLLRALVEAEIDGAALANQLAALKDTVDGITKVDVVLVHHDHLTVAPEKNEYRHNENFRVVVRNILSFLILFIQEKRLLKSHTSSVARQQDLLFEKIEVFSHTNHRLRELLREWSEYEVQEMIGSVSYSATTAVFTLYCIIRRGSH